MGVRLPVGRRFQIVHEFVEMLEPRATRLGREKRLHQSRIEAGRSHFDDGRGGLCVLWPADGQQGDHSARKSRGCGN